MCFKQHLVPFVFWLRLINDGAAHADAGEALVEDRGSDHDVQVHDAVEADASDAARIDAASFGLELSAMWPGVPSTLRIQWAINGVPS